MSCVMCHMSPDLLTVNSFARSEFCLGTKIAIKNNIKKNFVKLYQKYEKGPVLQALRSKIKIWVSGVMCQVSHVIFWWGWGQSG